MLTVPLEQSSARFSSSAVIGSLLHCNVAGPSSMNLSLEIMELRPRSSLGRDILSSHHLLTERDRLFDLPEMVHLGVDKHWRVQLANG